MSQFCLASVLTGVKRCPSGNDYCSTYRATCQCSFKQEGMVPINKFLNRTERMKPQRPPRTKTGESRRPQGSSIFFLLPYKSSTVPTPLEILTVITAPQQGHGKKRKRLMKMNKISTPTLGPWEQRLLHSLGLTPRSPSKSQQVHLGPQMHQPPSLTHAQVPKDQVWDCIKGVPLLAPQDPSRLDKDREQP